MARKSSITRLDPRIRSAVDDAIRDGRATIEEIVFIIRDMGGEISKSAVGRYKQNAEAQMARYRDVQEVAKVWVGKLQANPEGDVGRMLSEILKTIAAQTMGQIDASDPQSLMFLAKALKDLASTDKLTADRILMVRREAAKEAADKVKTVEGEVKAGRQKLDLDTLKRIREEIYGIV